VFELAKSRGRRQGECAAGPFPRASRSNTHYVKVREERSCIEISAQVKTSMMANAWKSSSKSQPPSVIERGIFIASRFPKLFKVFKLLEFLGNDCGAPLKWGSYRNKSQNSQNSRSQILKQKKAISNSSKDCGARQVAKLSHYTYSKFQNP